jgi:hypothetical protein
MPCSKRAARALEQCTTLRQPRMQLPPATAQARAEQACGRCMLPWWPGRPCIFIMACPRSVALPRAAGQPWARAPEEATPAGAASVRRKARQSSASILEPQARPSEGATAHGQPRSASSQRRLLQRLASGRGTATRWRGTRQSCPAGSGRGCPRCPKVWVPHFSRRCRCHSFIVNPIEGMRCAAAKLGW